MSIFVSERKCIFAVKPLYYCGKFELLIQVFASWFMGGR